MTVGAGRALERAPADGAAGPPLASRLLDPPHARPFDPRRDPLPPPLRPDAALRTLDVSKWFAPASGGVRTYLLAKAAYVEARADLAGTIVVPGARSLAGDGDGVRLVQLASPPIPFGAGYRLLHDGRALRRVVAHERPHVVEAGSPFLVPWMAARAARDVGAPLVLYHHGLLAAPAARGVTRRAVRAYLRALDRRVALHLVASEYAERALHALGISRTARAPLGVDLALFHPMRRSARGEIRARLGVRDDAPLVGYVGRLAPEKSLDVLLDAWPAIERATGATLVLAGSGPLRARLERGAAGLRVRVLDFERDRGRVADLVAALDACVAPGGVETFGLAALEAMASGVPVLGADRGGGAELVRASGAGRTFAHGRADDLARALRLLLADDRASLGRRGRAFAEREHAWERAFDRLFALYASLVR